MGFIFADVDNIFVPFLVSVFQFAKTGDFWKLDQVGFLTKYFYVLHRAGYKWVVCRNEIK